MNIEHRTSNIEHRILMALCFVYFKTNDRITKGSSAFPYLYLKIDRIHYSMLDVQCSMLDVHFFNFSAQNQLSAYGVYPRN